MKSVDAFYQTAIEKGAKCNGSPSLRHEYEKDYCAAFVIDPDGNNIEVVFIKSN